MKQLLVIAAYCLQFFSTVSIAAEEVKLKNFRVEIENIDNKDSLVRVRFINNSQAEVLLFAYNFCERGVILQDIFQVKKHTFLSNEQASYGGVIDLFSDGDKTIDQFLKIPKESELSCEVDISSYYLTISSGKYVVKYFSENPAFKDQSLIVLGSNEVIVTLPEAIPIK